MSCFITLWGVIGGSGDRSRKGRSRLPYCVVGLAAVAALVAGCSSSDGGTALPPLTPSATAPGSTPSASPSHETKQQELAAAKAIVRRYYQVLNGLHRDMNAAALARLMTPSCSCRAFVRDVRQTASRNERYFGKVNVTSLKPTIDSRNAAEVLVNYDSAGGGVETNGGHVLHRGQARKDAALNFRLERRANTWLIYDISLVDEGHQ